MTFQSLPGAYLKEAMGQAEIRKVDLEQETSFILAVIFKGIGKK